MYGYSHHLALHEVSNDADKTWTFKDCSNKYPHEF